MTTSIRPQKLFQSYYSLLVGHGLGDVEKEKKLISLTSAVSLLKRFVETPGVELYNALVSTATYEQKYEVSKALVPEILEGLDKAHKAPVHGSPKLWGVTRWVLDKFTSISYIANKAPTIARLVEAHCRKSKKPSASIEQCWECLKTEGSIQAIINQANEFLKQCAPIKNALELFSDVTVTPRVLSVFPVINNLRKQMSYNEQVVEAILGHRDRVRRHHLRDFFMNVQWLNPMYIQWSVRNSDGSFLTSLPSTEIMNAMLRTGTPMFSISDNEFNDFLTCEDYGWARYNRSTQRRLGGKRQEHLGTRKYIAQHDVTSGFGR